MHSRRDGSRKSLPTSRRRSRLRPECEALDPRVLLTATITEVPTAAISNPNFLTAGPDGNLWCTDEVAGTIDKIGPDGTLTAYSVPVAPGTSPWDSTPFDITAGPEGNLWFTVESGQYIGRISPSGVITTFPAPAGMGGMAQITWGPDGNLWFTESHAIGRITPSGVVMEFPLPQQGVVVASPGSITSGPDGNLWFTAHDSVGAPEIGEITTDGQVTLYATPAPATTILFDLVAGADGNLWYAREDEIGRVTPSGQITEFPVGPSGVSALAAAPDGSIWFVDDGRGTIGRLSPDGTITEAYSLMPDDVTQAAITTAADGSLWTLEVPVYSGYGPPFTAPDQIGHIVPGPVSNTPTTLASGTTIRALAGYDFSGRIANFETYANAAVTAATIDWGDGTTTTGTISTVSADATGMPFGAGADEGFVTGDHVYAKAGTYTVTVTLQGTAPAVSAVGTCTAYPDAITGVDAGGGNLFAGVPQHLLLASLNLASLSAPAPDSAYHVTIDWGDGTTTAGALGRYDPGVPAQPPYPNDSLQFGVVGDHLYASPGSYTYRVTIVEPSGLVRSFDGIYRVTENQIQVSGKTLPSPLPSGNFVVATFRDDEGGALPLSDYSATIDWGDGTTTAGVVQAGQPASSSAFGLLPPDEVLGSHVYAAPGQYTVRVMVSAPASFSGSSTTSVSVPATAHAGEPGPTPGSPTSPPSAGPPGGVGPSIPVVVEGSHAARLQRLVSHFESVASHHPVWWQRHEVSIVRLLDRLERQSAASTPHRERHSTRRR